MALWSTTELLSEPGVTLCVVVVVFGLVRWRLGRPWAPILVGVGAACAIQFRSELRRDSTGGSPCGPLIRACL